MQNILQQLVSAVTGRGADTANDTDDVQLPAPLPPYSFTSPTPAPPKNDSNTAVELTSPPGSLHSSRKQRHVPDKRRNGPALDRRASADEKRLTGDYDVPADRVFAPDPTSYFRSARAAMVKPGSGAAFQPGLNTLDGPQRAPNAAGRVQYGKKTGPNLPSAARSGQAAFEEFYINSPATPARKRSEGQSNAVRSVRASPTKRRKTEASTTPQIIDLDEEDEVTEIPQRHEPVTPALRGSLQSTGSRPTSRGLPSGPNPANEPSNEFLGTEDFIKYGRRPGKNGTQQRSAATIGDISSRRIHNSTAQEEAEEDMAAARASRISNPRRTILKDFKQGVQDHHSDLEKPREMKSRHFENAQINESTFDIGTAKQPGGVDQTLRSYRRALATTNRDDHSSDDELGRDFHSKSAVAIMGPGSPSNPSRIVNGSVKRKSKAQEAAQGWPLIWARTYGFNSQTASLSDTRDHPLILRRGEDPKRLEIAMWKDKYGVYTVPAAITSREIIKVIADDVSRIRLEGSRTTEGMRPISDLQFKSTAHLNEFRNDHLPNYCATKNIYRKPEGFMEMLFSKPLPTVEKAKQSLPVQDAPSMGTLGRTTRAQAAESAPWSEVKTDTQRTALAAPSRSLGKPADATAQAGASARPIRKTRATAPSHDSYDGTHNSEVEKFSEVYGLGTRWVRELTFGEGRQRAQVIFEDLERLDDGEFLNDNLINFYMTYLFKQSKVPPSKVHFFNTFFFNRLKQHTGRESINYEAVKRWTRDDIFLHDYIVVPINEDVHWYLAIICNVRNIERKAIEEDFDDVVLNTMADEDEAPTKDADAHVTESLSVPTTTEAPDPPVPREEPMSVYEDDGANLFDEESELNLIDPDATHPVHDQPKTTDTDSPRLSPPQQGTTRDTPSIFDPPAPLKTILSNLSASPEKRKKRIKRRSTALKRDPTQPVIIILDSLSQTRSPAVRALKDWVAAEGAAKRGMEADIKGKALYPKGDQIPTQNNFVDCGVYLLGYAEKFFQDPDEFKRKLLLAEMTPDEDWPQLKPKEMRNNLRDIIFSMANEQQLTVPIKKKKGKKSALAAKSLSVKADAKAPETEPPSSLLEQPKMKAETPGAAILQARSAATGSEALNAQHDPPATVPKLGSPFSPNRRNKSTSPNRASFRTMRSVSPVKTQPASPHQDHIHGRRTHPEVHIPRQASPMKEVREQGHVKQTQTEEADHILRQRDSMAPSAGRIRTTKLMTDDAETESKAKKATGLQSMEHHHQRGTTSTERPTLNGHSHRPIEILDSQEASYTIVPSPPRGKITSSAALIHEPSFEEIPSFPSQVGRGHQVQDDSIDSQLVSQLDADDAQRAKSKSSKRKYTDTPSYQRSQSDSDAMEVEPPGNDVMDIVDDVIRETPESARRSPSIFPL